MNDRIYTLATRAWMNDKGSNRDPIIPREFIDKFAESIVEECCQALSPMLRDQISRGHAVDLIKQHFGVEE
jgi:hypothetical protein